MANAGQTKNAAWQVEMFQLLTENVQEDVLFLIDPDGHVMSWSKGAERLLGYRADEVLGRSSDRFFTPEDRQADVPRQEREQALTRGKGEEARWHLHKDGRRFWSSSTVIPLRDGQGTVHGFAKVLRDHTARAQAQEVLSEQETLLDLAPVLVRNLDDRIIRWTRGIERLYGWTPEEAVGQVSHELLRTRFPEPLEEIRSRLLREGRWEGELKHLRRDGQQVIVASQWVVHRGSAGQPVAILEVNQDITGQKGATEALEQRRAELAVAKAHLEAVFNTVHEGIIAFDEQGSVVFCNDAEAQIAGFASSEEMRRNLAYFIELFELTDAVGQVIPVDQWPVSRVLRGESFTEWECHGRRKDTGQEWDFSFGGSPVQDAAGRQVLSVIITRDITTAKQTERALRQSEEEYRKTFEMSAVGIAQVAPDGRWRRVNQRLCEITGYPCAELLERTFQEITHPDDLHADLEQVRKLLAREIDTYTMEKRYLHKQGHTVWVNLTVSLVRRPSGEPDYFISIVEDITRRRELEQQVRRQAEELAQRVEERTHELQEANRFLEATNEALRQSEERFRLMVEGVKDYAIIRLDPEGRIVTWNAGAERIKDYGAEEIIGQHFSQFYAAEDRERGLPERGLREAVEKGRSEAEGWRVRKDGSRFLANVVLTPLFDSGGRLQGYTKITRDITERKELERQLRRHAEELERRTRALQDANAALEAFGYSVSHDLRTPLRNMQTLSQALEEDYADQLDAGGKEFCRRIIAAARKMDTLISDLLSYSRLSRSDVHLGRVDLNAVLTEARSVLANTERESQAEVTIDGPLPPVLGHHSTLVHVLTNLLTNALKFVARGVRPKVHIRAEQHGEWVRLWIEDNGIGIAMAHQQRIFSVFERLHGEESYPGTGIGLAIVKKGVERLGGRAGVESELNRGSRFWVELPSWRSAG